MLVSSSQSSTQRPLGLSVEELFALDRQYRRLEQQQQQQHLAQLQAQAHLTSSNLNRLASRSLDLVSSSSSTPLTVLPSLEVHGRGLVHRPPLSHPSAGNYPRSHSIDQLRYAPPPPPPLPPPPPVRHTYQQHQQHRFTQNDISHQHHQPRHRSYLQHPVMATSTTPSLGVMYDAVPPSSNDNFDSRVSCKLRRQQPIKRESSRRIVVRPVVQRRREPSISSSCESLDEPRSPLHRFSTHQPDVTTLSVPFTPSASLIADVIADLNAEENRNFSKDDSFSDESDVNLYEMRVPIGKTYDTSDISVQLEGPKILIHCHTIEPTDKRGNYRKHEFKTELFVPDVVDDETIVAYLTEDGELIVEGKYQPWAWKEIKKTRQIEQKTLSSPVSPPPIISPPPSTSARNDGGVEQGRISPSLISNNSHNNNSRMINNNNNNNNNNNTTMNRIEILDNNRTVIHVGESPQSQPPPPPPPLQFNDPRSVSDIISRFNTLNTTTSTLWDGQYSFTTDIPPILIYHLRLPFETLMDTVRVQSDPQMNSLRIFIEQQERSSSQQQQQQQQQNKVVIRSTSRLCRLPRDRSYDFARLRVTFLKDNFIRIELPTLF